MTDVNHKGEEKKKFFNFPLQTWEYFTAGAIAGIAGLLSGYPLDTVKVRMQTETSNSLKRPPYTVFAQTVRQEGVLALYKGVVSPLVGEGFIQAIVFGTYGFALQVISAIRSNYNHNQQKSIPLNSTNNLKSIDYANAGCWVGLACSVVSSPIELIKSKLQIQGEAAAQKTKMYSGPLDTLFKTIKSDGIKGLYRGYTMTLAREVPSYAAYFWVYEELKVLFIKLESRFKVFGTQGTDLNAFYLLTSGGIAGVASWIVSYPQDVIKTRLQIQNNSPGNEVKAYKGPVDCFKRMMNEEGAAALTRGLGVVLIRAYIVNAVTFYAYEVVLNTVKKISKK